MNIKKGDTVKILAGKDSGKTGKVLVVDTKKQRVVVEGLNMFKKHNKPKRQGEKGSVVEVGRSIDASNVLMVCPRCGQPTRISHKVEGTKKLRICKKCKSTI
ncbi:MAG: 50S ribosomal protein L24 [Patescibacteria group bacterium]|nr:50S ribosomal protein L24 [Patescibacteria group bacterium]